MGKVVLVVVVVVVVVVLVEGCISSNSSTIYVTRKVWSLIQWLRWLTSYSLEMQVGNYSLLGRLAEGLVSADPLNKP